MASRPVFIPSELGPPWVHTQAVEFQWFPGFSLHQKQRNVAALHAAAVASGVASSLSEISSKSTTQAGRNLSAFRLRLPESMGGFRVENAFQAGKAFVRGGPFEDLLQVEPRDARRDERLRNSGSLVHFAFLGERWPLRPTTAFYDWLYCHALRMNPGLADGLVGRDGFTDIEFNPKKSLNCQAGAAALFVALRRGGRLEQALSGQAAFLAAAYAQNDAAGAQGELFS